MSSKTEDCEPSTEDFKFNGIYIPKEVKIKYFPNTVTKFSYDVLPLFEFEDYKRRLMHEVSIFENPVFAEKWKKFKEGWPMSARNLERVTFGSGKIPIFANYRRQKVPPDYYSAFVGPSSPEAVFRRSK